MLSYMKIPTDLSFLRSSAPLPLFDNNILFRFPVQESSSSELYFFDKDTVDKAKGNVVIARRAQEYSNAIQVERKKGRERRTSQYILILLIQVYIPYAII